jgi:hypothetical protein
LLFEIAVLIVGVVRYRHDEVIGLLGLSGLLWFIIGLTLLTPFFRWAFCIVLIFLLAVTVRLLSYRTRTITRSRITVLRLAVLVYALNTLIGDAYIFFTQATNTPYTRVVKQLDASVPDGVPVLTHIELWFAFKNNHIYTNYTRWPTTPYAGLSQLMLERRGVCYFVLARDLTRGVSPTTGETSVTDSTESSQRFYSVVYNYVATHGERIAVLETRGYGNIEVWGVSTRAPCSSSKPAEAEDPFGVHRSRA